MLRQKDRKTERQKEAERQRIKTGNNYCKISYKIDRK